MLGMADAGKGIGPQKNGERKKASQKLPCCNSLMKRFEIQATKPEYERSHVLI